MRPKQLRIVVCEIWCGKPLRLNVRKKNDSKKGGIVKKMILQKNIDPCADTVVIRVDVTFYKK